ncbi:hypothetical protein L1887_40726 [Cichorium endivia]|nr:hypothetical protein L1887_40726 [Cichorium endivia]
MAARRPFNRDEKVEVKMQDGEFAGAMYRGVIKGVWNHRYEVKMTTLTDGATGGPLNVHVEFPFLQPVPPNVLVEFKQFDFVEKLRVRRDSEERSEFLESGRRLLRDKNNGKSALIQEKLLSTPSEAQNCLINCLGHDVDVMSALTVHLGHYDL